MAKCKCCGQEIKDSALIDYSSALLNIQRYANESYFHAEARNYEIALKGAKMALSEAEHAVYALEHYLKQKA